MPMRMGGDVGVRCVIVMGERSDPINIPHLTPNITDSGLEHPTHPQPPPKMQLAACRGGVGSG